MGRSSRGSTTRGGPAVDDGPLHVAARRVDDGADPSQRRNTDGDARSIAMRSARLSQPRTRRGREFSNRGHTRSPSTPAPSSSRRRIRVRRERRLRDRVETIAVDHRWSLEAGLLVVDGDLGGDVTDRSRDLGDGHERTHIDDFRSGQHEDRPSLATRFSEPDLAPDHSSVQASTSDQNGSGRSGRRL